MRGFNSESDVNSEIGGDAAMQAIMMTFSERMRMCSDSSVAFAVYNSLTEVDAEDYK